MDHLADRNQQKGGINMYFVTKTSHKTSVMGIARIKGDAWDQMRSAVFEELESRDALGSFRHVAEARLAQDGGVFQYDGVTTRIDSLSGSSAFVDGNGYLAQFHISEFPDDKLVTPVLAALAEGWEQYGLTGKQKSQAEGLLRKLTEEVRSFALAEEALSICI